MTVEDQRVALDRVGEKVGHFLGVFYANDGMVSSRDSDWLPHSMNVFIILAPTVAKSCIITCKPGVLRLGMSEEAKELKCMGV